MGRGSRADLRNPIGRGFATKQRHLDEQSAPNVVYPTGEPSTMGPAGFGALASFWSPRRELGGTYDERWHKTQRPLFPQDWNEQTLLCAPGDQRTGGYLTGGEPVELMNMSPEECFGLWCPRCF